MKARAVTATLALIAAAALAVPAGAVAKPGYFVTRPFRVAQATLRGTHGYQFQLTVFPASSGKPVELEGFKRLSGGADAIVVYDGGRQTEDGKKFRLDLGKEGLVDAHFVAHKVEEEKLLPGCSGPADILEKGFFVGTIEIHGRQGFSRVATRRAAATISTQHRQVCRTPKPSKGVTSIGISIDTPPPMNEVQLIAGSGPGRPQFGASTLRPEANEPGFEVGGFSASISEHRAGVDLVSIVSAFAPESGFPLPDPLDPHHAMTVEPPAPFSGSATFELTSRTHAEWSGDLSVALPGFGRVPLTGNGIRAGLCEGTACSATLPRSLRPRHTHTAGFLAP